MLAAGAAVAADVAVASTSAASAALTRSAAQATTSTTQSASLRTPPPAELPGSHCSSPTYGRRQPQTPRGQLGLAPGQCRRNGRRPEAHHDRQRTHEAVSNERREIRTREIRMGRGGHKSCVVDGEAALLRVDSPRILGFSCGQRGRPFIELRVAVGHRRWQRERHRANPISSRYEIESNRKADGSYHLRRCCWLSCSTEQDKEKPVRGLDWVRARLLWLLLCGLNRDPAVSVALLHLSTGFPIIT